MTKNRIDTFSRQAWWECFKDDETFTLQKWRECLKNKERTFYEEVNARVNAGAITKQDWLFHLEMMPKKVMESISNVHGIHFEPTNDCEAAMWALLLMNWSIRIRWIEFLDKEKRLKKLKKSLGLDYETRLKKSLGLDTDFAVDLRSQADLSFAVCQLCFELYPRYPELQEMVAQPILLWHYWEHEQCFSAIQSSGLIPELYQQNPPKDLFVMGISATANWLSNISPLSANEEVFPEGIKQEYTSTAEGLIKVFAAKAAQTTRDKTFRTTYSQFHKALGKAARYVRDHEAFARQEMRNGQIVMAPGRSVNRQPRIAEQEYQPGVGYVTSPHVTKSLQKTE